MTKEKSLLTSMGSQSIQRIVQFQVEAGADLLKAIEEAVRREKIKSGVFVSGLGALSKGVFRNLIRFPKEYPVKDDNRLYLNLEAPLELVSLGGWVASKPDGTPEITVTFRPRRSRKIRLRPLAATSLTEPLRGLKWLLPSQCSLTERLRLSTMSTVRARTSLSNRC